MEEEKPLPSAASAPVMIPVPEAPLHAGTADDAPTQSAVPTPESAPVGQLHDDSALFGPLWPLSQLVKLDSTISRQTLRAQRDRLDTLGYKFRYQTQDWLLAVH
jgi:hypothetical protein